MTRFVLDAGAALQLVTSGVEVAPGHELLAPTLLRSQTLSLLHETVRRGELPADVARERLARLSRLKIRLLGDAVLRRVAWDVADRMGWGSTFDAEYVALTRLQGDALITGNPALAQAVRDLVKVASLDALSTPPRPADPPP